MLHRGLPRDGRRCAKGWCASTSSHRSVGPSHGRASPTPSAFSGGESTRALHHGLTMAHTSCGRTLAHPAHSRPLQSTLACSTVVMAHRSPEPTRSPHARAEAAARRGGGVPAARRPTRRPQRQQSLSPFSGPFVPESVHISAPAKTSVRLHQFFQPPHGPPSGRFVERRGASRKTKLLLEKRKGARRQRGAVCVFPDRALCGPARPRPAGRPGAGWDPVA